MLQASCNQWPTTTRGWEASDNPLAHVTCYLVTNPEGTVVVGSLQWQGYPQRGAGPGGWHGPTSASPGQGVGEWWTWAGAEESGNPEDLGWSVRVRIGAQSLYLNRSFLITSPQSHLARGQYHCIDPKCDGRTGAIGSQGQ